MARARIYPYTKITVCKECGRLFVVYVRAIRYLKILYCGKVCRKAAKVRCKDIKVGLKTIEGMSTRPRKSINDIASPTAYESKMWGR